MTLIDPALLSSLQAGSLTKKTPMANTLTAIDGAIADMTTIAKTAAAWAADNTTILEENQIGLETDTAKFKFGDGVNTYDNLAYSSSGGSGGDVTAATAWPATPPTVVDGVMTITDAHLGATLTATDGEVTLENRTIPLLNNTDPSVGFQVRLSFGSTAGYERVVFDRVAAQTGAVTVASADDGSGGLVDGVAEITPPATGTFTVKRLPGATKNYETSVNDAPTFRGLVTLEGGVKAKTGSVSGALTMAAHSGGVFVTSGNVTVPNEAGFTVTLKAGGAHTIGAGGAAESLSSGDVITLMVFAVGDVEMFRVAAVDVIALPTS